MLQHRIFRHKGLRPFHLSLFTVPAFLVLPARCRPRPAHIADNSFLVEEAYNQESGVVQHVSTFSRPDGGGAWDFAFTQEWPFRGMRHQLSYTVPVAPRRRQRHRARRHPAQLPLPAGRRRRDPAPRGPPAHGHPAHRQRGRGTRHRLRRPPDQSAGELRAERRARGPRERRSHPRERVGRRGRQSRRQRHLAGSSLGEPHGGDGVGERAGGRRPPQSRRPLGLRFRQRASDRPRRGLHLRARRRAPRTVSSSISASSTRSGASRCHPERSHGARSYCPSCRFVSFAPSW